MGEKLLRVNPYSTICQWADQTWVLMGGKVFKYLALQPPSLILPKIPFKGTKVRSGINCIFLSPPASGKSAISTIFNNFFTYYPFKFKSATARGLEQVLAGQKMVSIIVDDIAQVKSDVDLFKVIEGVAEEGVISRQTARSKVDTEIIAICTLFGVHSSISAGALAQGVYSRFNIIIIDFNLEDKKQIGKFISDSMGESEDKSNVFERINSHYKRLFEIQLGIDKKIKPIIGYNLPKKFRDILNGAWEYKLKTFHSDAQDNNMWTRELQDGFRFMLSSAFLDVGNRELISEGKGNILTPNEYDMKLAIELMEHAMEHKQWVYRCDAAIREAQKGRKISQADSDKYTIDVILKAKNS